MTAPSHRGASLELRLRARPVWSSVGLTVLTAAVVGGGSAVLAALAPGLPGYSTTGPSRSLVLVVVLTALLLALLAALGWWAFAGFTRPSQWRAMHLYWLPGALLVVPLLGGVEWPGVAALLVQLVGYACTGVFEEGLYRGVILGLLRPLGTWPAVLLSSLLFGLSHLVNLGLRGISVLIVLQVLGATVQGVGLAALRLRTNTIWPLVVFHSLNDLGLQLGLWPVAAVAAPLDLAMLAFGIVILRKDPDAPEFEPNLAK